MTQPMPENSGGYGQYGQDAAHQAPQGPVGGRASYGYQHPGAPQGQPGDGAPAAEGAPAGPGGYGVVQAGPAAGGPTSGPWPSGAAGAAAGTGPQAAPGPRSEGPVHGGVGTRLVGGQNSDRLVLAMWSTTSGAITFGIVVVFAIFLNAGLIVALVERSNSLPATLFTLVFTLLIDWVLYLASRIRTVLDSRGVTLRVGGRSKRTVPWPESRTGIFVHTKESYSAKAMHSCEACMVDPDGGLVPIAALRWTGPVLAHTEATAVEECSRIWAWAVARGYARETGRYTPLRGNALLQSAREEQESRYRLR